MRKRTTLVYPTQGKVKLGAVAVHNSMIRCSVCGLYWDVGDVPGYRELEEIFDGCVPEKIGCNRCVRTSVARKEKGNGV